MLRNVSIYGEIYKGESRLNESKQKQDFGGGRIARRLLGYLKPYLGLALICVLLNAVFRALHLVTPWIEGQLLDRVFGEKDADFLPFLVGLWMATCGCHLFLELWIGVFCGSGHRSNPP